MQKKWLVIILVITLTNVINYVDSRRILWSIVWLNKRGKVKKQRKFKQELWAQESISMWDRISMRYLVDHLKDYQSNFLFWWRVKRIFACVEIVLELSYCIAGIFVKESKLFEYFTYFMFIQTMVWFWMFRVQFGSGGHHTKYDIMRGKIRRRHR